MPSKDVVLTVMADRQSVKLTWAGEIDKAVQLDAAGLEGLIRDFAHARALLSDRVPEKLDPHPVLSAVETDARFCVFDEHDAEPRSTVLLALRHSGLGWLPFLLKTEDARDLAWRLVNRAIVNGCKQGVAALRARGRWGR